MEALVTWAGLIAAVGAIMAVIKIGMELGDTKRNAADAHAAAVLAAAKLELVSSGLSEHKIMVAQTYATNKALNDTEAQLAQGIQTAIQGVYQRLDKMTDRLDTLITTAKKGNSQ